MQSQAARFERVGRVLVTFVLAGVLGVLLWTATVAEGAPAHAVAGDSMPREWVIAVGYTGTVNIIDSATDVVYGPFLKGQLGSEGGGLLDVAVIPGGKTALISNFGDSAVFFVDVSNPISPSLITSVTTPMFAEDIAISRDGRYALVSDGGFSPRIAVIDNVSRTLAYSVNLGTDYVQAVDIAPNGTVVGVDYFAGSLLSLYPDDTGQLTVTGRYTYLLTLDGVITSTGSTSNRYTNRPLKGDSVPSTAGLEVPAARTDYVNPSHPVNVAVAPDGKTVLVCDVSAYDYPESGSVTQTLHYAVGVYQIIAPGVVTFTGVITGLERATQSIAFSADGTKAYLSGNGGGIDVSMNHFWYNHLSVLNISGPGMVSLNKINAVDYPRLTTSQLFGVDTIAVVNGKAYLGNPTISGSSNDLRVVNLSDYSSKRLDLPGVAAGVGVISPIKIYLPLVAKNSP